MKILSFEIGQKRNLSKKHEKYPINIRSIENKDLYKDILENIIKNMESFWRLRGYYNKANEGIKLDIIDNSKFGD